MAAGTTTFTQLTHTTFHGFVRSHRFVVIHFWAEWNGYDVMMRELLKSSISKEFQAHIQFATFDTDPPEHHEICRENNVKGLPCLALYQDGDLARKIIGMRKRKEILEDLRIPSLPD